MGFYVNDIWNILSLMGPTMVPKFSLNHKDSQHCNFFFGITVSRWSRVPMGWERLREHFQNKWTNIWCYLYVSWTEILVIRRHTSNTIYSTSYFPVPTESQSTLPYLLHALIHFTLTKQSFVFISSALLSLISSIFSILHDHTEGHREILLQFFKGHWNLGSYTPLAVLVN